MTPDEIKGALGKIEGDLKQFIDKSREEIVQHGIVLNETKAAIGTLQSRLEEMGKQLVAANNPPEQKTLRQAFEENEDFQKFVRDGCRSDCSLTLPRSLFEQKTLISSSAVGSATTGVLQFERTPGIVPGAERRLTVRDLLPSVPTTFNAIDYVKENVFTNAASPQTEGSAKAESALTFTSVNTAVKTLAHWIPATKQVIEDFDGLQAYIASKLMYGLKLKEETELLSGDNTGDHLNGLITQATAFNTGLLVAADGWTKIDVLRRAIQQLGAADETNPTFFVLHTNDWADIELEKDTTGRYIVGNPNSMMAPSLWGKPVVATNSITSGDFLVGNGTQAVIRDRMAATVDISFEHSTYFTENKIAIRAEERLALVVYRPASFIEGTFTTSP